MEELKLILEHLPPGVAHFISGLVIWMGLARLLAKWFSGPLQARLTSALAAASRDEKGSHAVQVVLDTHAYRVLSFLLDLTCSVKLPSHADFNVAVERRQDTNQT